MKQYFFSILQLTFNIRQIKKSYLKILENHQDFAFFVDSFKFKLYENLKRTVTLYRIWNTKPF